jgi:hypothetical protein
VTLTHVVAVAEALIAYALLAVAFFGWGDAAARVFRARDDVAGSASIFVWMGWAAALLVLQVVHLFLPLSSGVVAPVFVAGIILAVARWRRSPVAPGAEWLGASTVAAICFVIAAIWIASRSMLPPENFDSGLYHLPTIRWINEYPIVRGLGNLHGRFAFNQSFFTYAAAVNVFPFRGIGRGIANSFLLLLLLWQSIEQLRKPNHAIGLLMIPVVIYLGLTSNGIASPTPDLSATLLQLSMFMIFVQCISDWRSRGDARDRGVVVLAFLAATAITVKLSTLAFSVFVLLIWLVETRSSYNGRPGLAERATRLIPFALILGVWVVRGYLLSGCPVYPSTFGCAPVSWAVPLDKVADEAKWVFGWARRPGVNWRQVLGNWNWLGPWLARASHDIVGVIYPLVSSVILLIGAIAVQSRRPDRGDASRRVSWIILVPVVAGMGFWFFTAPDPRFGRVFFWLLTIGAALALISALPRVLDGHVLKKAVWATILVADASFIGYVLTKPSRLGAVSSQGWMAVESPQVTARRTLSGLTVYTPGQDDRCWNATLPCTPYFNPQLRLRGTGLASGFTAPLDSSFQIRRGQ